MAQFQFQDLNLLQDKSDSYMLENNNLVQNHPFHGNLKNYPTMPVQNKSLSID